MSIQLLKAKAGADFSPYLRKLYVKVRQEWFSLIPPAVQFGEQGVVAVHFTIGQNGKLDVTQPPVVEISSGKKTWTKLRSTRYEALPPFDRLPDTSQTLELRITFYYNTPMPSPHESD